MHKVFHRAKLTDTGGQRSLRVIRASESRYRRLFETARDGILLLNAATGQIEDANPYLIEMLGYSHAEFLGKKLWEVGTFADIPHCKEMFHELQANGYARYDDLPLRTKAGARIQVEFVSNSYDCEGIRVIQCNIRDISQRKRNEHDLQRFRAALDNSGDAIVLVDRASMRYIDVNRTMCELVGYSRQELIGKTPMELFSASREELQRDYDALIADDSQGGRTIEGHYRRKDGSLIPIETRRRALQTEDGWILVCTARDLTERKRAARELQESERRLSDMLGNIEMIAVMLDREARITYCNDHFLRLTGWRREEVIGRDWFECVMPAELGDMKPVFQALLANLPEAWHRENEIFTRSRERRLIRWSNSVLRSEMGDVIGTASIGEDITDQKQAESKIRRLNRVYAVLSQINALIVRARGRAELFEETCRIAVSEGGYFLARVVEVDADGKASIAATSESESGEFSHVLEEHNANPGASGSLLGLAIRRGKPLIANDVANDARMPNRVALTRGGNYALALLPIILEKRVAAVIVLRSRETGAFNEDEMRLLLELVSNLTFALDLMEKRERLNYLAYYDALTGLANRSLFLERVSQYMRGAAAGGHRLALFLIDLERFRNINDSLGRPAGDALLMQVSEWIARDLKDPNLIARLGSDHFAVVLPELKREGSVAHLIEKKIRAFADHPFRMNDTEFHITAKVGVALFPNDGVDADTLLRNAEAALKKAKRRGERYLFYKQKMTETVAGKLTLENQLRRALDKDEFVLHYQPKVNLASGRIVGAEALIRWNDPQSGQVPPGLFIPVLEETGLIYEVGRWALRQAIEDYLRWRSAGLPAVRIAVNVSPLQLRNADFVADIRREISIDPRAAEGLELEITESLIMEDVKHGISSLQAIRALGVTITIDDFGTGFSSLSHLTRLPVDALKIDRSFVTDMTTGAQGLALVSTIINLAHALKLKVVAEGVETEEQSRLLSLLRCDEMQGFLFSKPVPAESFEKLFLAPPVSAQHA